ncbi:MFS transporter [Chitinophaga sp. SYP-B3965]|uniref:MFS transporter n=1 Tax=Chitinophaga sp. SYP-B3965 TaxID=2663120 RepID=UPI00129980B8|nr:MFS transporter [Chitinophaga sp. SYP-B3965]MRG44671.1 MFS transporter [Chitinophaga sp. SYP-B3965]
METNGLAGRKEWIGLAVIALPCILYSMDLTVLNLAVPALSADLKPSSTELLWIMDIYGFLVAGLLITMGTLGDRVGRRKLLLIGAAAFGVASILAAFANSAGTLIAARALLGIAGATLAPSTLSLIRNMFHDNRQRTIAIGIWIASYSAGGAIGPLVGGFMLEFFWWGSVFLIGVPVMILLLILGPMLLPEFRDPNAGRLDLISAFLSLAAVLTIIFGLKKIAESGIDGLSLLSIAIGILLSIVFIRRQKTLAHPMIDLHLFHSKTFSAALSIYGLGGFFLFGSFFFTSQYLQLVLGLSAMQAGLWLLPTFFGFIVGSLLVPVFVKNTKPAFVMGVGLAVGAVGFSILSMVGIDSGLNFLIIGGVIYSFGLAPVFTLTTDLIIGAAPPEKAGMASAISETSAEFGAAMGIAILGSISTAIYRTSISNNIPSGVPAEVADTAKDTLGGAVAEAAKLSGELSVPLMDAAKEAFVNGLHFTAILTAVAMALLAVLAFSQLKQAPVAVREVEPAG